jgi:hypothetical protein
MPSALTAHAIDRSTYVVTAAFTDETGAAVTPSAVTWSLFNETGGVVNSRSAVSATPAASVAIVLSGADLAAADGSRRVLLIEATYDSTNGTGLTLRDSVTIVVDDLVGVV